MRLKIEIDADNAVFGEYPGIELGRILRGALPVIGAFESGNQDHIPLFDVNGNRVGALDWDGRE